MTGRGGGGGRRVLLPPINFLFRLLQQRTTVQIWLYEQLSIRIVGTIRVGAPPLLGTAVTDGLSRDSTSS
jgi:small nuclear ribonucleoprotein E